MWSQNRSELDELETENLNYTATAKYRSNLSRQSPGKHHQPVSDGFYIGDEIFRVPNSKVGRILVR